MSVIVLVSFVVTPKWKKPASAFAGGLFQDPFVRLLTQATQIRRHARHVMMVMMTMVNANLHLEKT
jgi:hypothetical protein